MGRKKKLKCKSWITGESQKESTNKRSSSSLETQTTMGSPQQHTADQHVFPKDDFAEGIQPWRKLLFDVKISQKCRSCPIKENFSKSSPVNCSSQLNEEQYGSCKLSSLLGDITLEDLSSQSYLILMTLKEDDNAVDNREQLHNTELDRLDMNEMSSEPNSESRLPMSSVLPLRELCQNTLAASHLKSQGSPVSEIMEHSNSSNNLRRIEKHKLSYSIPSLRDLSKLVVDRLQRVRTNTNCTFQKSERTTSSSSEGSVQMIPTLRHLCETEVRDLHQEGLLSKETEGARTATYVPNLEDTKVFHTVPSLRHLAGMTIKSLHLSFREKESVQSLKDSKQSDTVPRLRHLADIVVKGLHLRSRNKLSDVPSLEERKQYYTVPSLRHLAGLVVKTLRLSSGDNESNLPSLKESRQSYTVPSLRHLAGTVVKNLRLSSEDSVSVSRELESSGNPTPVTDHLFTVPSLRHLCQTVVDGLRYKPKEGESIPSKTNDTPQQIPSLLDLKISRPRIQCRPNFLVPTRARMPQMDFSRRPRFLMAVRHIMPRVRLPMAGPGFWRMNGPPPHFRPWGGACERYGVPPFGPRYGWF